MTEYFPKPINDTDEFFEKLEKVKETRKKILEDKIKQNTINEEMEETRRDSLRMEANSIISAENFYIWHPQNYHLY